MDLLAVVQGGGVQPPVGEHEPALLEAAVASMGGDVHRAGAEGVREAGLLTEAVELGVAAALDFEEVHQLVPGCRRILMFSG